jgi:hypothetical protein
MAKNKNKNNRKNNKNNKTKQKRTKVVYVDRPMGIGAQIGDGLQKLGTTLFTKFMGTGDYTCNDGSLTIKANSLIRGGDNRAVKMNDRSTFIMEHAEFISDITSSSTIGAFKSQSFTVNPANPITFPWLSNMATSFETYEIEGLIFRYVSTSGESVASTNTAIGSAIGTFVYDTLDAPFTSKQQMLQYDDTVDCRTSQNFVCGVECDKSRIPTFSSKLYVGVPPVGSDPKLYNAGNFVMATQGMQAASVTVGELWVHYRIKFHITKDAGEGQGQYRASYLTDVSEGWFAENLRYSAGTILAPSVPTVGPYTQMTFTSLEIGAVYKIDYTYVSDTSGAWTVANPLTSGATSVLFYNDAVSASFSVTGAVGATFAYSHIFKATANTVVLSNPVTAHTGSLSIDFTIIQLDSIINK